MQRENLQYLERENVDLQREARDLHGRVKACEQAINRHDRQTDELRVQVQRAEANAERLQDELEANAIQDGRLDALKAALQEAEEEKTILENSYGDGVVSRDKLNAIASELNAQLRSFDEQIQDLAAKIKKAEMNASRQMQARHTALQEKNQAISAVQDAKDAKRQEEARRRAQAQHTLEFAGQAANVGPRVAIDPGETAESLDKKLSKLVEDVNRFERQ
jgi:ATP-dependent RNA helicase DDX6/DHH1